MKYLLNVCIKFFMNFVEIDEPLDSGSERRLPTLDGVVKLPRCRGQQ